jgi:hypothetical protein
MKAILLLLLLLPAVLFASDFSTNTVKAFGQPFTIMFDASPANTNEQYRIYANRVPLVTLQADEFTVVSENPDGSITLGVIVPSLTRDGKFSLFVCAVNSEIEGEDSNPIDVRILKPKPNLNRGMREEKVGDFRALYYPIGYSIWYKEFPWSMPVKVTNAYNPHIVRISDYKEVSDWSAVPPNQ